MAGWVKQKDPICELLRLSKGTQVFDNHRPECWSRRELVPAPMIAGCVRKSPYGRTSHGSKVSGNLSLDSNKAMPLVEWSPTQPFCFQKATVGARRRFPPPSDSWVYRSVFHTKYGCNM